MLVSECLVHQQSAIIQSQKVGFQAFEWTEEFYEFKAATIEATPV